MTPFTDSTSSTHVNVNYHTLEPSLQAEDLTTSTERLNMDIFHNQYHPNGLHCADNSQQYFAYYDFNVEPRSTPMRSKAREGLMRIKQARRHPTIERIITLLEDKRITDTSQLYQLEDLNMPRLRCVLNVIFVTLGVTFLLAVLGVIAYTSFF